MTEQAQGRSRNQDQGYPVIISPEEVWPGGLKSFGSQHHPVNSGGGHILPFLRRQKGGVLAGQKPGGNLDIAERYAAGYARRHKSQ